jgi:hypothetical protein
VNGGLTWHFFTFILSNPAFNSFPAYPLNAANFNDKWRPLKYGICVYYTVQTRVRLGNVPFSFFSPDSQQIAGIASFPLFSYFLFLGLICLCCQ